MTATVPTDVAADLLERPLTITGPTLDAWDDESVTIAGRRVVTGGNRFIVVGPDQVFVSIGAVTPESERVWHQGGSTTRPFDSKALLERFWSKVAIGDADECWPWTGGFRGSGYGQFMVSQEEAGHLGQRSPSAIASRVACILAHGLVVGAHALHDCDNPPCCNPAHLHWGSHAENMREASQRRRCQFDEQHHQAKLTDDQVREVIARARAGESVRTLTAEFDAAERTIYGWLQGKGRGRIALDTCNCGDAHEPGGPVGACRRCHRPLLRDGQVVR